MGMQLKIKYFKVKDFNENYNNILNARAAANDGIIDLSKNRYSLYNTAKDMTDLETETVKQEVDTFIETHKVVKVEQIAENSWKIIYKYSDIDKLVDDLTAQRRAFPFEKFETYCQMQVHLPTKMIPEVLTENLFKEFCDLIQFDYKAINKKLDEALIKQEQELTQHVLSLQTL